MKKNWLITTLAILLALPTLAQPLTPTERTKAVDLFQKTKSAVLQSVNGLSPVQLAFKANPTRWSVADCLEHIALSEVDIFKWQQGAVQGPADASRRSEVKLTDEEVVRLMTNRSGKANAPEVLKPLGKFSTTEAALQTFVQQRDKTIEYLKTTPEELRTHYWKHPMGLLDTYQALLLLAAHSERHRQQIEEVKTSLGFPK